MHHSAVLTVNRVVSSGDGFQRFTAVVAGSQRVDQMVTFASTYAVAPGEVYEVSAVAPPEVMRDSYGRRWHQWGSLLKVERLSAAGRFAKRALTRLAAVGELRAKVLWDAYGSDVLQTLLNPEEVDQVAQLLGGKRSGRHAAMTIHASAIRLAAEDRLRQEEFDFHIWLEESGVDVQAAGTAWRLLQGVSAADRLRAHPYLLAGLTDWRRADRLGRRLLAMRGVEQRQLAGHPERFLGALDSIARSTLANGDTEVRVSSLYAALESKGVPRPSGPPTTALAPIGGQFVWNGEAFQPIAAAWMERRLAKCILGTDREEGCDWRPSRDLADEIRVCERLSGITLTDEQRTAVETLLRWRFGVFAGGAGTGKTYTMRILVDVFAANGGNVVMAALAGKAALTLAQATGRLARTITQTVSLLRRRLQFEADGREVPEDWPRLDGRSLLLLDEASMIDTSTLLELFELVPPGCRVILVGDNGQLPPVGWGQVFHDLVAHGWNTTRLTQIQRQRAGSGVALFAATIREGRQPDRSWMTLYPGVTFVEAASNCVIGAVVDVVDQLGGFDGNSMMVCAARRNTVADINRQFASRSHTETNALRLSAMGAVSRDDPVVFARNRYGDAVTGELRNGMLGRVVDVFPDGDAERDEPFVSVMWHGESEPRVVVGAALADLELAYAITAHRAQGSGVRDVIIVLEPSAIVTRQWLYTAVSRAKERVWLVGEWGSFSQGLSRTTERSTGFWRYIQEQS